MKPFRTFFFLFLSVVFLGFSVFAGWRGFEKYREYKKVSEDIVQLERESKQLEDETKRLSDRIEYLRTPEYVEREMKEKQNMKKPEENVAVVRVWGAGGDVQENESVFPPTDPQEGRKTERPASNPQKWWDLFFGRKGE